MGQTLIQKIYKEINDIRNSYIIDNDELSTLSENKKTIYDKAMRLQKIGFTDIPEVKKVTEELEKVKLTNKQINNLLNYEETYPDSSFITLESFMSICEKYGLVYHPIKNYSREISDRILLELEKVINLNDDDAVIDAFEIIDSDQQNALDKFCKLKGKIKPIFTNDEVRESHVKYRGNVPEYWFFEKSDANMVFYDELKFYNLDIGPIRYKKVKNREGYLAVAPPSHFNSKGNIFSFKNLKSIIYNINEPIICEMCKFDFVRILTTSDEEIKEQVNCIVHSDLN